MKYLFLFLLTLPAMETIAAIIRSRKTWGQHPFHSSGCNAMPDGNWKECCEGHDRAYRSGGWAIARLKADVGLLTCIWGNGNPFAAIIYFLGVRLFGMWAFQYGKKRKLFYE